MVRAGAHQRQSQGHVHALVQAVAEGLTEKPRLAPETPADEPAPPAPAAVASPAEAAPAADASAPEPSPSEAPRDDGTLRLSKRMAELGLCSRREADEYIE